MSHAWPKLNYQKWKPTYETLHRWFQVVGKLRLCKSPWVNHSWNSALYVTSRGLTTSAIPLGDRSLTVDFDFIGHKVIFQDSHGLSSEMFLQNETVASFYQRFCHTLSMYKVEPTFEKTPNEVMDATPFHQDTTHCTYNPEDAHNLFQVLVRVSNVLLDYRSEFVGKSSPVHFFWGSFDLAVTRFSGLRAPDHPGGVPNLSEEVVREAYSHEVMSCGFWPGNEMYPKAAFYAYAYPEPDDFMNARINPQEAYYHQDLKEFILDYDDVRKARDPVKKLRKFLDSAYTAVAEKAHWDRDILEVSPHLSRIKEITQSSFADKAIRQ